MGDVLYNVQYSLDCEGAVKIDFTAMVSAPTPINLANHVYFNLAGHRAGTKGLNEHVMKMAANSFTPVSDKLIPTGSVASVAGTVFDLRTPTRLGDVLDKCPGGDNNGFDHNFVLANTEGAINFVCRVLTGDKQETAINIAYSCRLFSTDMEVIKLNARSRDAAESALNLYLDQCKNSTMSKEKRALGVDGKTLIYILDKRANIQHLFLSLTKMCSAVLACRATPLQKAYLVRIVKEVLRMHTLAIGDGANDVSMIQTADIGVGISGQEGMQAVMASDFAITRFRFIERLLLIHGHWCYDRLSRMVLHFFYKNAAFVFVCFWFQLYCGFSGQVMIDQMYLMLFNLFFTSLPPVAVGVFDRDAPADLLSSSPDLYAVGRLSTVYKPHSFWVNMADALYQSLVVFFVAFGAFNGSDMGLWEFGTLLCSQCILVMLIQLGVETKSWTIFHWMAMLVSVVLYLGFGLTYNAVCSNCAGLTNPYWVMQHGLMVPVQYLVLIITAVLSTLPRVFMRAVTNTLQPTGVITAVRLRRQERNTKKMLDKVETKAGFVKFFRSSSSDVGNSLSSSTNVENGQVELSDTEMTNM